MSGGCRLTESGHWAPAQPGEPTARQLRVLAWIADYLDTHGWAPTVREIGEGLSMSPNGVKDHLKALERKGCLAPRPRRSSRALRITELGHEELWAAAAAETARVMRQRASGGGA